MQDRYVEGECPFCAAKDARGDQCESCGRVLDALDLLNPVSKIDKSKLVKKETENYFLDLKKLQPEIQKWLTSKKGWRDWVKNEALGWVKEGLKPRAITRDMDYGVALPVSQIPEAQKIKNIQDKVFYVWFEAVIGYLSAAIEYSKNSKKPNAWKDFFYNKKAETYYFVGQDNLVFHTINWPAQLIAYDKKINLPTNVFVNKFLLLEGQKMSKSKGWFIDTKYLVENYPIDAIRFYLALNLPEQKELNFTWKEFIDTNNNILVATIGNFIHRSLTFAQKNFGSTYRLTPSGAVQARIAKAIKKNAEHLEKGEFRYALQEVVELAAFGNQYIDKHQVWNVVKKDKKKAKAVVVDVLAVIDALQTLLYPFVPESAQTLKKLLGGKKGSIALASTIMPLFEKIDERNIAKEVEKLQPAKNES